MVDEVLFLENGNLEVFPCKMYNEKNMIMLWCSLKDHIAQFTYYGI